MRKHSTKCMNLSRGFTRESTALRGLSTISRSSETLSLPVGSHLAPPSAELGRLCRVLRGEVHLLCEDDLNKGVVLEDVVADHVHA